jgi:NAD(P)-dependent dehydrogenase (short-subunit alcohol dehydrogenase family)
MTVQGTSVEHQDFGLAGKSAFVTGAGGGIGRAIALALAKAGVNLALFDLVPAGIEETARQVQDAGGAVMVTLGDVTDRSVVRAAVAAAARSYGRLDCGVNNAGILGPLVPTAQYPIETFRKVIDINVMGVVHCLQAELEMMESQGSGAIVNVASAAGLVGWAGASAYVASKHAVVGLTKTAGIEYAAKGIRINSVCPAFVTSPMTADLMANEATRAAVLAAVPMGRIGTGEEVANAVKWLLSPLASFSAGLNLALDGGSTVI